MKHTLYSSIAAISISFLSLLSQAESPQNCPEFLNQDFKKLHDSTNVNLCEVYKGKPLVIVNTASHCGYTKQFSGLEKLYKKYKEQGVELIGFTSDSFRQAAKSEKEAASICYKNYGVTFTMLAPTPVKGNKANPVFAYLSDKSDNPSWNFNKYLVSADGAEIKKYGSKIKPLGDSLEKDLNALLAKN